MRNKIEYETKYLWSGNKLPLEFLKITGFQTGNIKAVVFPEISEIRLFPAQSATNGEAHLVNDALFLSRWLISKIEIMDNDPIVITIEIEDFEVQYVSIKPRDKRRKI